LSEIARITTLEELVKVCKTRRHSLGLSQLLVDEISGMQDGYTAKLEAGMKGLGKITLPLLLGALKIELAIMPATSKHQSSRALPVSCQASEDFFSRRARKAAIARAEALTPKQRRKIASAAAKVRWARVRAGRDCKI
jgi:hypothetical protein